MFTNPLTEAIARVISVAIPEAEQLLGRKLTLEESKVVVERTREALAPGTAALAAVESASPFRRPFAARLAQESGSPRASATELREMDQEAFESHFAVMVGGTAGVRGVR